MTAENVAEPISADEECRDCGYEPELKRTLGSFQVFAISFAFISVAVGIFGTYDDLLRNSGPVGIWTWIIAAFGQLLIALVIAQFAARIALSGSSYQWASRLANPKIGWFFGWLTFCYLITGLMAINSAMASQCLMPLFNMAPNENTARIITVVLMVVQAVLAIASTKIVGMINSVGGGRRGDDRGSAGGRVVDRRGSDRKRVSRQPRIAWSRRGRHGLFRVRRRADGRHARRPGDAGGLRRRREHGRGSQGSVSQCPPRHRGIGCRGRCSGDALPDRPDRGDHEHPRGHRVGVARRGDHGRSARHGRRAHLPRRDSGRVLRRRHGHAGQLFTHDLRDGTRRPFPAHTG